MNERIKELAAQCWETRKYSPPWFDYEKFAKLILVEVGQHLTNRGLDHAREVIEKDFGI